MHFKPSNFRNLFFSFATLFILPHQASAGDLAKLSTEVEQFADSVCGRIEVMGSSRSIGVKGKAEVKAELKILRKKLAEIGFESAIDYFSGDYIGVLQQDLASDRSEIRDCRLRVWADLRGMVSLANNSTSSVDQEKTKSEQYDLPIEIRVSKHRPISILDGSVEVFLNTIQVSGRKKRSSLSVKIPNRTSQTMTLSPDHTHYPPFKDFDFKDSIFEIEIVHQNIEDQIATIKVSEAAD